LLWFLFFVASELSVALARILRGILLFILDNFSFIESKNSLGYFEGDSTLDATITE
jgi:hypothetical protein